MIPANIARPGIPTFIAQVIFVQTVPKSKAVVSSASQLAPRCSFSSHSLCHDPSMGRVMDIYSAVPTLLHSHVNSRLCFARFSRRLSRQWGRANNISRAGPTFALSQVNNRACSAVISRCLGRQRRVRSVRSPRRLNRDVGSCYFLHWHWRHRMESHWSHLACIKGSRDQWIS